MSSEARNQKITLEQSDKRIVLKGRDDPSILPVIEKAKENGWKSITVKGNWELCRATWFEARMAGLKVDGYLPTREDEDLLRKMEDQQKKVQGSPLSLSGGDIAQDYSSRVIPFLQKRYDSLRKQRAKLGVTTTDTDRAYGINMPQGYAREVDEKFDRAKGAFLRAIDSRTFFLSVARQKVPVTLSFEDGIARFVMKESDRASFMRNTINKDLARRQD
jgi:hypothetical protein